MPGSPFPTQNEAAVNAETEQASVEPPADEREGPGSTDDVDARQLPLRDLEVDPDQRIDTRISFAIVFRNVCEFQN